MGSIADSEIFQITKPSLPPVSSNNTLSNKSPATRRGHDQIIIISNNVPSNYGEPMMPHLWLMFASGCYFANLTNEFLTPVFDPATAVNYDKNLKAKAHWRLLNTNLCLPECVYYFNDGRFTLRTNPSSPAVTRTYPAPYDRGFTNAIYAVTTTTNTEDGMFPVGFSFQEFVPGASRSRNDLRCRRRMDAIITSVSLVCSQQSFTQDLDANAVAVDRRLAHSQSSIPVITYTFRGDKPLPSAEQARKIHARQERRKMFARVPKWVLPTGIIIAAVPTIVLVGNWVWKRLSRGKRRGKS